MDRRRMMTVSAILLALWVVCCGCDRWPLFANLEGTHKGDCTDGEDNDDNEIIDCEDEGCFDNPECPSGDRWEGNFPGECSDGQNQDGDDYVDCEDDDCWNSPECEETTTSLQPPTQDGAERGS